MLDLVKDETDRMDSRFLEPAIMSPYSWPSSLSADDRYRPIDQLIT